MDAQPELALLARVLHEHRLEAVLIGNMAAALHGAPVTTIDIDFFFRRTPRDLQKLKAVAKSLGAVILRPYYPASDLFRLQLERDGLQLDFMGWIDGVKSYESVWGRATEFEVGGNALLVSALEDIIRSKRAAVATRIARFSLFWKQSMKKSRQPGKGGPSQKKVTGR
jgi:hypothetical protein